jgi:hypothetical protein
MGRRLLLDQAVIDEISDAVGKGAFLYVAAEAARVSRRTLLSWLERGRQLEDLADAGRELDERESLYVELVEAVRQSGASARLKAESTVWKRKPLEWLRFGPGRDHGRDDPGWTKAVGEVPPEVKSAAEQMLSEALRQLGLLPEPVTVPSTVQPALTEGNVGAESDGEDGGD